MKLFVMCIMLCILCPTLYLLITAEPCGFYSPTVQVEHQRKVDSLRSVIELNKKLLKIYENN